MRARAESLLMTHSGKYLFKDSEGHFLHTLDASQDTKEKKTEKSQR